MKKLNITIAPAKITDAQEIRLLEKKIWKEEVTNVYDAPMFIHFGYVFVAKHEGKVVGAITSIPTRNNEVYVLDLVVDARYRKQGIAERLYKKLLTKVRGKNVVSFLDPDNTPTIELHKKLGGKVVSRIKDAYNLGPKFSEYASLFVRIKN